MITAIRAVRRAKGLTLDDVARRCDPPTTAQTIGRLETGTRTVSVGWLNRIAAALDVATVDLVTMPERADLPVVAILDSTGIQAPTRPNLATPPQAAPGQVALTVAAGIGDYRAGDVLWCTTLAPAEFDAALYRDVLVPRPAGRFAFGRLVAITDGSATIIPPGHGTEPQTIDRPVWIARAVRLIREL